jgi:hypothetical protein
MQITADATYCLVQSVLPFFLDVNFYRSRCPFVTLQRLPAIFIEGKCRSRRLTLLMAAIAILIIGAAGHLHAQNAESREQGRPVPALRPEARPDVAVAETGKPTRIEVLENDIGISDASPELRIEEQPNCGTAEIDGRAVIFKGGADCLGVDIRFGYGVRVGEEWIAAIVSVTMKPAAFTCGVPGLALTTIKIEGGQFDKASAPPGIADFLNLIEGDMFSVQPFCIFLDAIPVDAVDEYLNNLDLQQRTELFPELQSPRNVIGGRDITAPVPARVSQRIAIGFAKRFSEKSGRELALPTLQEYVAAAWELQSKHAGSREADAFLVSMRSGNLQWTSTPCDRPGVFLTIGPNAQGRLAKICYEQSRLDRTGFRIAIR